MKRVSLLYGREGMEIRVPASARILCGAEIPALPEPERAVAAALADPVGSPPLAVLLRERQPRRVAITVSDITRPVPNRVLLPPLLDLLAENGVPPNRVVVIIGTGMHRPSTPAERGEILGPVVSAGCEVIDHRADAPETLVEVAPGPPPVRVCRRFVEADFRIVTGLIEPHFMAGFSGGRKGVCPALVDLATVQRFHGVRTLDDPRARNGILEGNPCHRIALGIARAVGVDFLLNAAITRDRRLAGVYAGDLEAAHEAGCRAVGAWTTARVEEPCDLVVTTGGGYPLDQTFYQAVKGMCAALSALKPGGVLLQVSRCAEGLGSPAYRRLLLSYGRDWQRFLADIRAAPDVTRLDQWEFQMQCRVLAHVGIDNLRFAGDGIPGDLLERLALTPLPGPGNAASRIQRFLDEYHRLHPQARVAVIPEGPYTLVIPAPARARPQRGREPH
jgi:nickel-dependent lactate racemase